MRKFPLIIIGAIVAVLLFLVLCTYVKRPYEEILVLRFGKFVEPTPILRGWNICLPTDSITRVDKRSHLFSSDLIETTMKEGRPINVRLYAAWKIVDSRKFYLRQGSDEKAMDFIRKSVTDKVFNKLTSISMDELFNDTKKPITDTLEENILSELNDPKVPGGFADQGLLLEQVGFSRLSFPTSVTDSVYGRMVAERAKVARTEEANGQQESTAIIRAAEIDRNSIINAATAEAAKIKGEGEQQAIQILSDVINDDVAEKWFQLVKQSDLLTTITNKWTLILPADSPILGNIFTVPPTPKGGFRKIPATPGSATPTLPTSNPIEDTLKPIPQIK